MKRMSTFSRMRVPLVRVARQLGSGPAPAGPEPLLIRGYAADWPVVRSTRGMRPAAAMAVLAAVLSEHEAEQQQPLQMLAEIGPSYLDGARAGLDPGTCGLPLALPPMIAQRSLKRGSCAQLRSRSPRRSRWCRPWTRVQNVGASAASSGFRRSARPYAPRMLGQLRPLRQPHMCPRPGFCCSSPRATRTWARLARGASAATAAAPRSTRTTTDLAPRRGPRTRLRGWR